MDEKIKYSFILYFYPGGETPITCFYTQIPTPTQAASPTPRHQASDAHSSTTFNIGDMLKKSSEQLLVMISKRKSKQQLTAEPSNPESSPSKADGS